MKVQRTLGPGFLESVYHKALAHELRKANLVGETEKPVTVAYDGMVVGDFSVDLLIEASVLVENKAVNTLSPLHEVQVVNYLTATGIEIGVWLNFRAEKLEFKRKYRTCRPKAQR